MDKNNIISKIDIAIILTIITGVSYGLSYVYKAGEFLYYNIPLYFIDIGTRDVFFIMLLVIPIISVNIWSIYSNTDDILNKKLMKRHLKQSKRYSLLKEQHEELSSSLSLLKKDYKERPIENVEAQLLDMENQFGKLLDKEKRKKKLYDAYVIFFFIISFSIFIGVVFYLFKPESVLISLFMIIQLIISLISAFLVHRKNYFSVIIFTLAFFLIAPFILGYQNAVGEKKYITFTEDNETFVVLTIYKEQFLFAPLDKDNRMYKDSFYMKEIKEVINFEYESIGSLTKGN